MNELDSIFDTSVIENAEPPTADTTLRNPLVLKVFEVLNNVSPDITGYCKLMLRERDALQFAPGDLDYTKTLGTILNHNLWILPQKTISLIGQLLNKTLWYGLQSYQPIAQISTLVPSIPETIIHYWTQASIIVHLILKSAALQNTLAKSGVVNFRNNTQLIVGKSTCNLIYKSHTAVLPRDWFLMFGDIVVGRAEILLFSFLSDVFQCDKTLIWTEYLTLFRKGDLILYTTGNDAYKRFKLLEAYVTSLLLNYDHEDLFPSSFPDFIQNELAEFKDDSSILFFESISKIADTPEKLAEIFGLFRMWGHPVLDTYKARDRVKRIAQCKKTISQSTIELVDISFKKHLSLSFFKKHSRWPNLNVDKLPPCRELYRAVTTNTALNQFSKFHSDRDWLLVTGEKTFDFPYSLNIATLLADKSHSLQRTRLKTTIRNTRRCGNAQQRRVILSFLNSMVPSVHDIVREFSQESINEEYLVFGLREKEREVSNWARLFGLMTLPCRFYFVLTEQLLAHDIVPLFPETTVGDSLITIRKKKQKIYESMRAVSGHVIGIINLDFEKWNLNMRYESTYPAFKFLDELYDSGLLFRNSHHIFSHSTMYLCHGVHPVFTIDNHKLTPLSGPNVWRDHLGGIEGLRQKGWTLMTIAILKEIADSHHVAMQLLGQGDNQVLCVHINVLDRSTEAIKAAQQKFNNFKEKVFEVFTALGLPIKSEETWSSSRLFAYGKDLYYNGRRLGLRSKRASRLCFLTNEGYPSFAEYIGSVSSATATLNDECNSSLIPWLLYAFNIGFLIRSLSDYHPIIHRSLKSIGQHVKSRTHHIFVTDYPSEIATVFTERWEEVLKYLLLGKSVLTGLPSLVGYDLLTHGFPDTLTLGLTWAYNFLDDPVFKDTALKVCMPRLSTRINPLQLCEDPCSLPLDLPPTVRNRLRSTISDFLSEPQNIRNPNFRRFFSLSLQRQDDLAKTLFTITPCNPRIMSDLLAATPIGQANAIVAQVSATTTMAKLMYTTHGDRLTEKLAKFEMDSLLALYKTIINPHTAIKIHKCPTRQARYLRVTGWGKDLVGVTVPFSLHYIKFTSSQPPNSSYIILRHSNSGRYHWLTEPGPFPEYFGSMTMEKTNKSNLPASANLAPLIKRPINLLRLLGWVTNRESKLAQLICDIYSASTDIPRTMFDQDYEEVSGSVEHRYEDSRTSHRLTIAGGWLSPSHVLVTLSKWEEYAKGSKNKTIHFQEVILNTIRKTYECHLHGNDSIPSLQWGLVTCNQCIIDTYEGYYDFAVTTRLPTIPSFPDVDTLFLRSDQLTAKRPAIITFNAQSDDYDKTSLSFSYGVYLATENQKVKPGTLEHVDPVSMIKGFSCAMIARYLYRRIINPTKDLEVSSSLLKKLSRKVINTDLALFEPIELLCQYSRTLTYLLTEYGLSCVSPDVPSNPESRRSTIRTIIALTIHYTSDHPLYLSLAHKYWLQGVKQTYSNKLTTTLLAFLVSLSPFSISSSIIKRLQVVDAQYRSASLTQLVSFEGMFRVFKHTELKQVLANINNLTIPFETAIKKLPVTESLTGVSPIIALPSIIHQANPICLKTTKHRSEIRLVYLPEPIPDVDLSITHRLYKPICFPTGAWYKWVHIIQQSNVPLARPACLGDGAGGLSRLCYDMSNTLPKSRTVFYSTLPYTSRADEYSYEEFVPAVLIGLPNVFGLNELQLGLGDLTDSLGMYRLSEQLIKYNPTYITCDAEHSSQLNATKDIVKNLVELCKLLHVPFLLKAYALPTTMSRWVLSYIHQNTGNVVVYHTPLSPEESSEIFIHFQYQSESYDLESTLCSYTSRDPVIDPTLSIWRLPILASALNYLFPIEVIKFNLPRNCDVKTFCVHVITYTEIQMTSIKHFPDVGRPGVGQVQYISSTHLGWLVAAHHTFSSLAQNLDWTKFLKQSSYTLFLMPGDNRIQSSINPSKVLGEIKYIVKKDRHVKQVLRHWASMMSFLLTIKRSLY